MAGPFEVYRCFALSEYWDSMGPGEHDSCSHESLSDHYNELATDAAGTSSARSAWSFVVRAIQDRASCPDLRRLPERERIIRACKLVAESFDGPAPASVLPRRRRKTTRTRS